MADLIQISPDIGGQGYIGVDHDGRVWKGRIERDTDGRDYIAWKHVRSEFERLDR